MTLCAEMNRFVAKKIVILKIGTENRWSGSSARVQNING